MAAHTRTIALYRLDHPANPQSPHTAKAATSVDQLSGGRLLLGVASGDRPVEFPHSVSTRSNATACSANTSQYFARFSAAVSCLDLVRGAEGADLIPKPTTAEIPFFVTGHSRQTLEWIARYSHGWISYPRAPKTQQLIVESWRTAVRAECELFKPFTQSLYIDLADNPQTPPRPIHLGYQLGRYHLISLLESLQEIGVNHVIVNLKYGQRPASEVIEELGQFVLPNFVLST